MGGARAAVYALLVLVLAVLVDLGIHATEDTSVQDADIVYCTAPSHLGGLVSAAVSLGLTMPGSTPAAMLAGTRRLPISRWRTADPADFKQACDAYAAANMPAQPAAAERGSPFGAVLDILLPVVAGALLALAADDVKRAGDRRWVLADELRSDWRIFDDAARSYAVRCMQGQGRPPHDDLDAARRALLTTVRKIRGQYRGLAGLEDAQKALLNDPLGPSLKDGWDIDDPGKSKRNVRVTESLDSFGSLLGNAGDTLARRIWLRWKR